MGPGEERPETSCWHFPWTESKSGKITPRAVIGTRGSMLSLPTFSIISPGEKSTHDDRHTDLAGESRNRDRSEPRNRAGHRGDLRSRGRHGRDLRAQTGDARSGGVEIEGRSRQIFSAGLPRWPSGRDQEAG